MASLAFYLVSLTCLISSIKLENSCKIHYLNHFQAQFANVVATAADYDSDRETEQNRVKQILQDLDESFSKDEGKITTHLVKAILTHSVSLEPNTTL